MRWKWDEIENSFDGFPYWESYVETPMGEIVLKVFRARNDSRRSLGYFISNVEMHNTILKQNKCKSLEEAKRTARNSAEEILNSMQGWLRER